MERDRIIGVELNQINHIYLQGSHDKGITKMYIRYNDGFIEVEDVTSNADINGKFKNFGVSKVKGRDYSVHLENDDVFADLDARLEKQAHADEYDFNFASDATPVVDNNEEVEEDSEDLAIINLAADEEAFEDKEYSCNEETKKESNHLAARAAIVGLALLTGAGVLYGIKKFGKHDEDVVSAEEPAITTEVELPEEKISLEGKDWDYYFENAKDSVQKESMTGVNDFVMNFNRSEDWMYEKLTPEMIEALKEANIIVDGDEAIFGFTAEQVFALNLVYGTHTNEEYTTMMNGEAIDITKVMSSSESLMNQGIRAEIVYLLNSDQTRSGIEEVINFTEDERTQIYNFLDMLQVYKELLKEEKYTEAEKKMKDIKVALVEYAQNTDTEVNNAKPWILRTILPACSIYSVSYQYMDTITLNLYDGKTGEYVDKKVKTWLFDEITMRDLVEGYKECVGEDGLVYQDGFDSVEFLKQFNISTQRYSIVISDNGVSIADEFIGGLEGKLKTANEFMQLQDQKNLTTDAAYLGGGGSSNDAAYLENNSKFDELTKDSFDSEEVLDLINDNLVKENKYPKNLNFFTSIYSKFSKQIIAFKDAIAAKVGGKKSTDKTNEKVIKTIPGRTIYVPGTSYTITWTETWTEEYVTYRTERRANENYEAEKAAAEKAAVEKASKTTVTDGATGKEKETTYQDIYNKEFNDNTNGKNNLETNLDDDDITNQKDPLVNKVENWAKEDAEENKKAHEEASKDAKETYKDESGNTHYISGGDEHIEEEYKNADTVTESEAEEYNRRLREQQNNSSSEPAPAPTEEYTHEDPTTSETFAPVYEESNDSASLNTSLMSAPRMMSVAPAIEEYTHEDPTTSETFAPAYEEEIDNIIESLSNEAPAEASEGMSR